MGKKTKNSYFLCIQCWYPYSISGINMKTKIYAQEIADGLEEVIQSASSIAYTSEILEHVPSDVEITDAQSKIDKDIIKSLAQNNDQIDLFYLSAVLVTTGWNKNDDVFAPEELWKARRTPEDKQFNFMHNEKDIIGHITGNYAVGLDGSGVDDDTEEIPSNFNIITNAVVYTSWSDIELRERIQKIIAEIQDGDKWFVSMECLFPSFDYALMNSKGESKIVKREEASAYLTKHLRAYGGTGEYEGYKVGRVLKNISFSGKGLVSKPANPRSVILKDDESSNDNELVEVRASTILKEKNMSDVLQKQINELKSELVEAREYNDSIKKEMEAQKEEAIKAQVESFEGQISEKDQTIAEMQATIDTATTEAAEVTELKEKLDEITQANEEALAKIESMEQRAQLEKRKAALIEAGVAEEEVDETISSLKNIDDEAFDNVLALVKKKGKKIEKKEDEDPKVDEKGRPNFMKKKAEECEALATEEGSVVSDEILDEVEETADVALAEAASDDETEDLRSTASEWFGSFLKSTANLQK